MVPVAICCNQECNKEKDDCVVMKYAVVDDNGMLFWINNGQQISSNSALTNQCTVISKIAF